MTEVIVVDDIKQRYEKTSRIRNRVIDILTSEDEALRLTIADGDSAKLLVKMLDGEDKQTIARQKNATDEKIVGVVSGGLNDIAEKVIQGMGGMRGIRGEPNAAAAPTESIPLQLEVSAEEMKQGENPDLNYDTLVPKGDS